MSHRLGGRTSIELDADPNRLGGLPWPWRLGGRCASEVEVEEVVEVVEVEEAPAAR